jgi:hypothetical protein
MIAAAAGYVPGMERGSDKHGARSDDALAAELRGMLGEAGGHREEWRDPEPPADDDPDLTEDRPSDRRPGPS